MLVSGCSELMRDPACGRCSRHGKWFACNRHCPWQTRQSSQSRSTQHGDRVGYYPPPSDDLSKGPSACPVCRWESDQANKAQGRADEAETERRNAEERRKHPDPTDPVPGWIAEFRAQGYGPEGAEALASKRLRENPPKLPSRRQWTASDIRDELWDGERQRKLDTGEFGICPVCKADVLVSQGIVLKNGRYVVQWVGSYEMGGINGAGWEMCRGEGSPVAHAGSARTESSGAEL
jgi:hypothetical protein